MLQKVDPAATGTLSNTATVSHPTDTDSNNDSATDSDTLTPQTDLGLALTTTSLDAIPGSTKTFTATVTNNGPSSATGGTVSSTLPAGLTFSASGHCTEAAGVVTCNLGAQSPASQAAVSFTVLVDAGLMDGATLNLSADVSSNEADQASNNDSDSLTLTVASPIFVDGFESGDTSSWSSAVP